MSDGGLVREGWMVSGGGCVWRGEVRGSVVRSGVG